MADNYENKGPVHIKALVKRFKQDYEIVKNNYDSLDRIIAFLSKRNVKDFDIYVGINKETGELQSPYDRGRTGDFIELTFDLTKNEDSDNNEKEEWEKYVESRAKNNLKRTLNLIADSR